MVPIDCGPKPNQPSERKLRPIGLAKSLTKFVEAAIIDDIMPRVLAALEPTQLGAGTPDGCVIIVRMLQAWIRDMLLKGDVSDVGCNGLNGDESFFERILPLDLQNAYGRFLRSAGLKGMLAHAPRLQHLVLSLWGNASNTVWPRCEGSWRSSSTSRGGFQRLRILMLMFCFSLEYSFDQLSPAVSALITRVGYQDDQYLVGNVLEIAPHWSTILEALGAGGHNLNMIKSEVYLPRLDNIPTDCLPSALQTLLNLLKRSVGGIKCLGSAAEGRMETLLGPFGLSATPANTRLENARQYAQRIEEFIDKSGDDQSLHVAWLHITKSLSRALSYDARLLFPETYNCVARQLDEWVVKLVQKLAGLSFNGTSIDQTSLPGPLGGLACRLPSHESDAAFLSTWMNISDKVTMLCSKLGREVKSKIHEDEALCCVQRSGEAGIHVHPDGKVHFTPRAASSYVVSPWHNDVSISDLFHHTCRNPNMGTGSKLHGRILRGLHALREVELHKKLPEYNQEILLSCSGPGVGKLWNNYP